MYELRQKVLHVLEVWQVQVKVGELLQQLLLGHVPPSPVQGQVQVGFKGGLARINLVGKDS